MDAEKRREAYQEEERHFLDAVRNMKPERLENVFQRCRGAYPHAHWSSRAFFYALGKQDYRLLAFLTHCRFLDINQQRRGLTPLFYAVKHKDISAVRILVQGGADVMRRNGDHPPPPFFYAVTYRRHDVAEYFAKHATYDIESRLSNGDTLLHRAVYSINPRAVELLLEMGANPNARGRYGKTCLELAEQGDGEGILGLLESRKDAFPEEPIPGSTLHDYFSYIGARQPDIDLDEVERMCEMHQAHINERDWRGDTVLLVFADDFNDVEPTIDYIRELIDRLLNYGAAVDARNYANRTASLVFAEDTANYWAFEPFIYLVSEYGADVDVTDDALNTALHYWAYRDEEEFDCLGQIYDDVDPVNVYGDTPLHVAVKEGHRYVTDLLLEFGADTTIRNENGHSPFDIAVEQNNQEIAAIVS